MNLLNRVYRKLGTLYRQYVRQDPFLLEAARWFKDKGDDTLRLDYPLTQDSIVFDVGGYHGDFAAAIHEQYGCSVYIFEPVKEFYQKCVARFRDNTKIICLNYGLSSTDGWFNIGLAENASSFTMSDHQRNVEQVRVRSVIECIRELRAHQIDLLKINIEGGEFDLLPAVIRSGDIKKVLYLQVQFHNFIDHAASRRAEIRSALTTTHTEMWNYDFVWESWKRTSAGH
jgi:FkbM family methyltransferase